jgi:hypothetical protein
MSEFRCLVCGKTQCETPSCSEHGPMSDVNASIVERLQFENAKLGNEWGRAEADKCELRSDLADAKQELAELRGEVSNAHSAVYNITPNRTETDMLSSLDEQIELLRQRHQTELADARKAALSLYTSMLAGFSHDEIVRSALEKWPWLGPPEPKLCPHEAAKRYTDGVRPEHSPEAGGET